MTIGNGIRRHLLDDATIAALVAARVYPLRLPQPKPAPAVNLPAITISRISVQRLGHLRGTEGVARPRVQVDYWAPTHDAASQGGALVRQRLNGFAGTFTLTSDSPAVEVYVQGVFFADERDLFEEDIHGGVCRHSADYLIFHSTNVGTV